MKIDLEEMKRTRIAISGACSGVYFLFHNEDIVYVGEGWNCFLRVAEHTRKESIKEFTSWDFIPIADKQMRKSIERDLRAQLKTKYNRV